MRGGIKAGNSQLVDGMILDGLWDSFSNTHMGNLAEYTARRPGVIRAEDQTASRSPATQKARRRRWSVPLHGETVATLIEKDESPRKTAARGARRPEAVVSRRRDGDSGTHRA